MPAYGQAMAEVMDPESGLRGFGAEMALIAETPQSLGLTRSFIDPEAGDTAVAGAVATLTALVEGLQAAGIRTVILQTLPVPADPWAGHLDARAPGALPNQVAAVNAAMADLCASHSAVLFDADAIAALIGRGAWHDAALWHRAKVPFALDYVPLYAEKLGQLLRALRGKASKCLVLDLDNTCWGGVIGDDGLEGIQIGQGSAQGEAFLALQHYALSLKERGVVLAVCSKNEEDNARLPFEQHPDMALKMDDFAVFMANWTDKASNISHIAKVLNIGVDALVFLDDNPAERARVRQELPQVSVPEVGEDASLYPAALAQGGYFETVGLSADDAKRAEQYRANAQRAVAMETIGNYDDYLKSLEMVCTIQPFDAVGRTRIAQLINKSNQFNLTTPLYRGRGGSDGSRSGDRHDAGAAHRPLRRQRHDRSGDLPRRDCRRGAGLGLRHLADVLPGAEAPGRGSGDEDRGRGRARGRRDPALWRLAAEPQERHVEGHYAGLGFSEVGPIGEGGTRWVLDLAGYTAPDLPMVLTADLPVPA